MRFKKIYIEINNTCNFSCSFCIHTNRCKKYMSVDEFKHIINEIKAEGACLTISKLQINGNDIIALGANGAEIGQILRKLLSDVVDEEIENEKTALVKRAAQLYKSMKH